MRMTPLSIDGAWILEPDWREDARGRFGRLFCVETLAAKGIDPTIRQVNSGRSLRAGTVRGIHWQVAPHDETKIVRCTAGRAFDVVVDLRPHSATRRRWTSVELSPDDGSALVIPPGCGHAWQALTDGAEIQYTTSRDYAPLSARGARWDDPALAIAWPLPVTELSDADRAWPPISATGPRIPLDRNPGIPS